MERRPGHPHPYPSFQLKVQCSSRAAGSGGCLGHSGRMTSKTETGTGRSITSELPTIRELTELLLRGRNKVRVADHPPVKVSPVPRRRDDGYAQKPYKASRY